MTKAKTMHLDMFKFVNFFAFSYFDFCLVFFTFISDSLIYKTGGSTLSEVF